MFKLILALVFPFLAAGPDPEWPTISNTRLGKDYALFFAVSQYQDSRLTDLPNSVKNARDIEEVLKDKYGFKTELVEDPKLDDIERKLEEYRQKFASGAFPKDGQLLIFFSGHGVKEYNNGYFLPADADPDRILRTGLSYNTWRPFISEINCRHILVAVDACYSVTFDPKWQSMETPTFNRIGEMNEADRVLSNHKEFPARIFFTSDSQEDVVPGRSNFARKFLEGLSKLEYKGTFVTSSELFANYIRLAQPAPRANEFEGDDPRSSFLFFPSETVKTDPRRYEQRQRDMDAYAAVQATPTISGCQRYLADFPEGNFRAEVTQLVLQLQEEQEWKFAGLKNTVESYQGYLERFPGGKNAGEAKRRIKAFQSASPADDGLQPIPGKKVYDPEKGAWKEVPGNMVVIQGGSFDMGDVLGEGDSDEKPVHSVSLSGFYLGKFEVTNEEFARFLNASPVKVAGEGWERGAMLGGLKLYHLFLCQNCNDDDRNIKFDNGRFSVARGYEKRPVSVSWYGAIHYCNWLSEQQGYQPVYTIDGITVTANWEADGYRLPTEAEWEFAARSRGQNDKWAGTSSQSDLKSYANFGDFDEGISVDQYKNTAPVGSFRPNKLGLFDMSGNLWEWCWDRYDEHYYSSSPSKDPRGPDKGDAMVRRGGDWNNGTPYLRCTNRSGYTPDGTYHYGFRLAKSAE